MWILFSLEEEGEEGKSFVPYCSCLPPNNHKKKVSGTGFRSLFLVHLQSKKPFGVRKYKQVSDSKSSGEGRRWAA